MKHAPAFLALLWLGIPLALAQPAPVLHWDPGLEDCTPEQQRVQAQAIDETTIALRQNPCVDYEAPLMYLLIGHERALLIDSGVADDPKLTAELTGLVARYLARADGSRLPLVVAHSHGHQDHRAGDAAFAALPQTTVVSHEGEAMRQFFGFRNWPADEVRFELGGRQLVIQPTPGHHPDHLVFFDSRTRLLFTGDFYLPGRLLVDDIDAYRDSAMRLVEFVQAHGVQYALGAHIEMDARGELFPDGASYHPNERNVVLPMGIPEAVALHAALEDFNGFYSRHGVFAVVNPVHNLLALAAGLVVLLALAVWGVRRLMKSRRSPSPT
jgi:hydroxyacylglutathione hydrolase